MCVACSNLLTTLWCVACREDAMLTKWFHALYHLVYIEMVTILIIQEVI